MQLLLCAQRVFFLQNFNTEGSDEADAQATAEVDPPIDWAKTSFKVSPAT
jgi:hypothetical protein